ncbi:MAG: pgi, glucose-6-phosphate isomerase [Candidatus Saccharibacteria bacterium]|nr:pgi, glucose-6-phosphate isomerase [Candidatus Saccharibacteria bacterium]
MLDDTNILKQRDPKNALGVAADQWQQVQYGAEVLDGTPESLNITKVVIAGMGGSALAALLMKAWLEEKLKIPLEVVREYELPTYVDATTLVVASSYSGNTEETIACLAQAEQLGAHRSVIAAGGKLIEQAEASKLPRVQIPAGLQPRMAVLFNLKALAALLTSFGVLSNEVVEEVAQTGDWLKSESDQWTSLVPIDKNYAKQLALIAVGKTPVFYGGRLTGPVAYKWKISWNENAKNVSFWNVYSEANHNEFIGWSSHPIEKPFVIFDIKSSFEHERILKRFEITDRLLSGMRPKANTIELVGDTPLKQLLWGSILADFVSIYLAVLNGVDPTPVDLVEKLKTELVK